ncbi:hypothetical protein [Amycolatopsis sp. H20-H5]|uniref:hypothetical protein n=1 Tax=Amycolatopsis sp. H20-H5 TaxID=3046309 RepID=UPI002DB74E8D|nr:hypothetical protein [Amycolatopsis sp. H20-H5]MEC3976030.1 hypothetical protein [Amycolatopsis sp. H20-H5]
MIDQTTQPIARPSDAPRPPARRRFAGRRLAGWTIAATAVIITAVALSAASSKDPATDAAARVAANGRIATVVVDRQDDTELVSKGGGERFRTASVVKLLIALDELDGPGRPDARLGRMLSNSDDTIASALWSANGGPAIVTRTAAAIGLRGTTPPETAGRWGDTLTTADDVVSIYRYLLALPGAKREPLLRALRGAPRLAADGFDQYFGIPRALDAWPWAIKQGWAAGRNGVDVHTTGLVGEQDRYIVVVLTSYPEGSDLGAATRAITAAAATLAPKLVPPTVAKRK